MVNDLGNVSGLSLESIIINHIWTVAQSNDPQHALPYACYLTPAFEKKRIALNNLSRSLMDLTGIFEKITCRNLKITTDCGRAFVQEAGTSGTQQQS